MAMRVVERNEENERKRKEREMERKTRADILDWHPLDAEKSVAAAADAASVDVALAFVRQKPAQLLRCNRLETT